MIDETRATSLVAIYLTAEPQHGKGSNEDGPFYYIEGYQILATMAARMTDHIDGVPRDGSEYWLHGHLFPTPEAAAKLMERMIGKELNPKRWTIVSQDFRNTSDLIQEDQELAMREREGHLL